jgi:hypothetical protein
MRVVKIFRLCYPEILVTSIILVKPNVEHFVSQFFQLSAQLSDMIGVTNPTEDGFSWALLKIQKDEVAGSQDMPLILEGNLKLAVALGVLNECFNPVKDRRTKIDMLHQAVYSLG